MWQGRSVGEDQGAGRPAEQEHSWDQKTDLQEGEKSISSKILAFSITSPTESLRIDFPKVLRRKKSFNKKVPNHRI